MPLRVPEFRAVVLGQLGEQRLDVASDTAHARALEADAVGPLHDIHRGVGSAIHARDLEQQNEELSSCLVNAANRFEFVVVGYSG